ncbi:Clp protease ClpP [Pseudothauera nasutitermitis]|uniref:ATP-dependent Clp protease proteolytic subunit n=1 Tax=Pseudothauera nasutitermitis TaxID=2565930 RepID=A0A4S4AP23_9RHOO|nr:head maturation protease, ClpP-related [Pseudothauera nasutitermitis]THF61401.1 Clp protease ClpP [Pseudothauera nasutitermitis]
MKKKSWYAYNLADDGRSATIRINGVIGSWAEGRTIESLDYELKWAADSVNEIIVRITSFGGSLAEALAMYGALRRHPAKKVAIIEGVAASAGTIVAMAADEIRIYANASMMVHGVSLVTEEGEEVEDAEAERVLNASIVETYAARTGKTPEELAECIATDTWMTAREAVAAGWADAVIEIAEQGAATSATAASPLHAIASALEIPADVLERAEAEAATPAPAVPPPENAPPPATAEATFAAQVNALAVAEGLGDYVAAWLLDGGITTAAQAKAAIKEAREVRDLCAFANAAGRAGEFIGQRKSLAEVRAELINARAAAADERHTDTHPRVQQQGQARQAAAKPAMSVDSIYAALNSTIR